jgi:diacylglycerol kinase
LSTLALDGPDRASGPSRMANALRYLDLALLALALPLFIAADFPMAGYLAIAGTWIVIYGVELLSNRAIEGAVARRDRKAAMGWLGATGLARAWIVALGVLIIGLTAGKDAGLAAAILAVILFTVHLGSRVLLRLTQPQGPT